MRTLLVAGTVGGLLLLIGLVLSSSPATIAATLTTSAWPVVAASLYHIVPLSLYTLSWRALIPSANRPGLLTLIRLRWIGESVNALLPVAQVGGDLARAHLLGLTGVGGAQAGATMVTDIAVGAATQVAFTLIGVVALALDAAPEMSGGQGQLARAIALAAVLTAAGAGALLGVAHVGLGRIVSALPLRRKNHPGALDNLNLPDRAASVDRALTGVFERRGELVLAFVWHLGGWVSQIGETWLILKWISPGVSLGAALIIESLAATARSAAFVVPGGLGVQEGALVLVATRFGVDAPHAVALGIVKRIREVLVGAPAILAWSIAERGNIERLLRRRTK